MRHHQLTWILLALLAAGCSKKKATDGAADAGTILGDDASVGADASAGSQDASSPTGPDAGTDAGTGHEALSLVLVGWSDGLAVHQSSLALRFTVPASADAQILLDGEVVQTLAPTGCATTSIMDVTVDISAVTAANHVITVRANGVESSAHFTYDPSAPLAERNVIEERARGQRIACFEPALTGDTLIEGELVLGRLSDGIKPETERLVISAGSARVLYTPTSFTCTTDSSTGYKHCSSAQAAAAFAQSVDLRQVGERRWHVKLSGGALPAGTEHVGMRLGDDEALLTWPGLAIAADCVAATDDARRVSAVIGPAGGSLTLTDASGVKVRLDVPMDALPNPVEIAMVPLQSARPTDPTTGFHPGVRFEPEGLHFAVYPRLTLELPAGVTLSNASVVVLRTSPFTAVPLVGARVVHGTPFGPASDLPNRRLVALLSHFSEVQAEDFQPSQVDFADWANEAISDSGTNALPIWALENMMDLENLREQLGTCNDPTCPELANLTAAVQQSTQITADAACAEGTAHPTIASVDRIMRSEALAESVGETLTGTYDCMSSILVSLCNEAGAKAATSDPPQPMLDMQDPWLDRMLGSDAHLETVYDYGSLLGLNAVTTTCSDRAAAAGRERVRRLDDTGKATGGRLYDRQRMGSLYDLGTSVSSPDLQSEALSGMNDLAWADLYGTRATCGTSVSDGLAALDELKDWVTTSTPQAFETFAPPLLNEIDQRVSQCGKAFRVQSASMNASCVMNGAHDQTTTESSIHDFPHTTSCSIHYDLGQLGPGDIAVSATTKVIGANEVHVALSVGASWSSQKYGGGSYGANGTVTFYALKDGTARLDVNTGGVTLGTDCQAVDYSTFGCTPASVCGCLYTYVRAGGPRDWTQPEQLCNQIEARTYGASLCQSGTSSGGTYSFPVKMNDTVGISWDFGSNQPGTVVSADPLVTVRLE